MMECAEATADQSANPDQRSYKALIDNLYEGFVICEAIRDDAGRLSDYWIRYANPVYVRRAPSGEAVVNRRLSDIRPGTPEPWFAACQHALEGAPVRFEFQETRVGRWYEVHMIRLSDREFGQLYVDVTQRKAAEQHQTDLLKELNHRVKNNLSVVSSILELQARASTPEVREHLTRAVDRVQSIAVLHELLYRQEGGDSVDFCAYLRQLAATLQHSMLGALGINVDLACESFQCPVREAVNLGLIVNELVTNAAKHAYGEPGGRVEISVSVVDGRLNLAVGDHGPGFPAAMLGAGAGRGLGLRLVRSLTEALGGRVTVGAGPGGRIEASLPIATALPPEAQQRLL
jgi:two-component sensor histidine kinase